MSVFKRDTVVQTYPAYDVVERAPITFGNGVGAINLTYGEPLVLAGRLGTYSVFTVSGYALEQNECPIDAYNTAVEFGHTTHGIQPNASVIHNGPHHKGPNHVQVRIGQLVYVEGRRFIVQSAPNDNLTLEAE